MHFIYIEEVEKSSKINWFGNLTIAKVLEINRRRMLESLIRCIKFTTMAMNLSGDFISELVHNLFQQDAVFEDIGHHDDLRNYVLRVNDKYILKIYGSKKRWQRELENLLSLHKSKFLIPRLWDYGLCGTNTGWIIMSTVSGEIIEKKYCLMSTSQKKSLWRYIGELLGDFHLNNSVRYEELSFRDKVYAPLTYKSYIENQYKNDKQDIVNSKYYSQANIYKPVFAEIEAWLNEFVPMGQFSLCHRDFCLRNILYDDLNNSFGLIDFEMSYYGQVEADFSRVILQLLEEDNFLEDFLDGYYYANRKLIKDINIIRKYLLL